MVASFVPEKHKKLVVHIRKMNERQKKKKLSKMEDSSREGGSHVKKSSRPRYMIVEVLVAYCYVNLASP